MKQLLPYAIVNGLFGACVYSGLVLSMSGPLNIALAIGWLCVGITLFVGLESMQKTIKDSPAWKRSVDFFFDTAVALVFIWYGYQWLGVLYFLRQVVVFSIWKSGRTEQEDTP